MAPPTRKSTYRKKTEADPYSFPPGTDPQLLARIEADARKVKKGKKTASEKEDALNSLLAYRDTKRGGALDGDGTSG